MTARGGTLASNQKRFINSGNWGPTKTATSDNDEGEINTFVYIDAEGPLLFYWPSGGHVTGIHQQDPDRRS